MPYQPFPISANITDQSIMSWDRIHFKATPQFRVPERDKVKLPERDKVERNVGCLGQDAKPLIHVRKVIAL